MWLNKDAALSLHSPNKREKMKEKLGKRRSKTEMVHSKQRTCQNCRLYQRKGQETQTQSETQTQIQENSENKTTKKKKNEKMQTSTK